VGGKKRREWGEHLTRMDAKRLVKIQKENIPAGRKSPGRAKKQMIKTGRIAYKRRKREIQVFPI
jgi:hypothetical protein